ncbi:hypothetical protein DYBT9275_05189 [Dyadobacter sp. CECT 9275]|uniref:Por secretion system C-terminal sorting domain-containing protein n=1 Tax=Dyadobacter helix TaxID=2822344 RepID=A0A916JGY8_9BACT|nr:T9SS C-terminal target domain-containing protein [Dyadobacter sp. CECT 9275]CAG5012502.1 hypothetical protein DYBT9275_05189 [Dyadobacter sp. CECT 9275]
MKHLRLKGMVVYMMVMACMVLPDIAFAQSGESQKTSIKIKVTEDNNGKIRDIEKSYVMPKMSDQERKAFVDKVLDSLGVDGKENRTVSVTVDDGDGPSITTRRKKQTIMNHRDEREPLAFHYNDNFNHDFDFDTEKLRTHLRNFERDFKPKAKVMMKDMEDWGERMGDLWHKEVQKPSSIKGLNVYSNNPDNGSLNVRFLAPGKGDVAIMVTDTRGKEVGKKEIKDFSGEFVGQVEIKKNAKGTLFVTVVQNEDGAVKRIVIP